MSRSKRTNMKPEERRNQLLDCANTLFFSKGFEDTTMADILAAADISKGGFYHHFASKDELLFGVLDRMVVALFGDFNAAPRDIYTPALTQLHQFLHRRSDYVKSYDYAGQIGFFSAMNADKNTSLLAYLKRAVRDAALPHLTHIIQQGCFEGVFAVNDPQTAAEMILHIGDFFDPALKTAIDARGTYLADGAAAKLTVAMGMQYLTIDRILALPDGTTNFGWPGVVELTMAIPPNWSPHP